MPDSPEELTIDELARMTGTTVRNVRAHQSRGLLPPPSIRARTGYYGPEQFARLRMIQAMQAEGFRLKAIERLLDRPGGAAEQIFNLGRTLLSSFGTTAPEFATSTELEERFGGPVEPRLLRRAEKLGLLRPLGEEIANRSPDAWTQVQSALERLRPLAVEAIRATFEHAMSEQIERQLKRVADLP